MANKNEKKEKTSLEEKQKNIVSSEEFIEGVKEEVKEELVAEIVEEAPESVRDALSVGIFSGKIPNPISEKVNEKHIDEIIKNSDKESQRDYNYAIKSMWFNLIYIIIGVGAFLVIIIFLSSNGKEDLLKDILKVFVGFVGGLGAGFGISRYTSNK
jgi:hypothetical protein